MINTVIMSDRNIGYIVLIVLFCTTMSVLGYAFWIFSFPKEWRTIKIDRVYNLKIEDPVKINGVIVGEIKKIDRSNSAVLLTIEALQPIKIYLNYKIYSSDKGIMGDRMLTIEPGNSEFPMMNSDDTLTGTSIPGVSDVLDKTWKLKRLFHHYKKNIDLLISGNTEQQSIVSKFEQIMTSIDTFTIKFLHIASLIDNELSDGIDTLNRYVKAAQQITLNTIGPVPDKLTTIEKDIGKVKNLVETLEFHVDKLNSFIVDMETPEYPGSDHLEYISENIREIRDMINYIRSGTVNLKQRWLLEF